MTFSPALTYSLYRLAIFAGTLLILWPLLGRWLHLLIIIAISFLLSGVLSFWMLARQRAAMAGSVEARVSRLRQRMDQAAAAEDVALDATDSGPASTRSSARAQGVENGSQGVVDSAAESDESR